MACPEVIGDAAFGIAGNSVARAQNFAGAAFTLMQNASDAVLNYQIEPVVLNTSFNFNDDMSGIGVVTPPTLPGADFAMRPVTLPPEAPNVSINIPGVTNAPTFNGVAPTLLFPGSPQLIALTDPGAAPDIDWAIDLMQRPDFDLPPVPTLETLNLPDAPTLDLPTFDAQRPDTEIPIPVENFTWTPEQYVERLLGNVVTRVNEMLAGKPLPEAVAQALRARAFAAQDIEESRAVAQAWNEHAARGFEEPGGQLNARIREARQGARNNRQQLNRDIYIQDQLVVREDIRTAINAGIQAEAQLIQLWVAKQQMDLDAAKYAVEVAISILNARISRLNALVALYEADARVYRERIGAELAKVEIYRAQLEGERTRGEINRQTVELYLAQLTGCRTLIDLYVAGNQGARVELDAKLAQLQGFRDRVGLMVEQLRGQQVQWEGVRTRAQIEGLKQEAFNSTVNAFATRVRAWSDRENTVTARKQIELDADKQQLDRWLGQLEQMRTEVTAEQARLDAVSRRAEAQVSLFRGRVDSEGVRSSVNERRFRLKLEAARAKADTDLKRADQMLVQAQYVAQIQTEGLRSVAQVAGNVGSSALSAASANVGVSTSSGNSRSCSESYVFNESN
jgi:hypothetical protein